MVDQYGEYTNLGLGINVYPDSVTSACVDDLDNITVHCYSPEEFREEGGDKYYWIRLPGTPIESNSIEEVFGNSYQVLALGNLFRFLYFTIRGYIKFSPISGKHQYRIPNTQYHLIEYRS
jgi:hypothetical protein